MTDGLTVYQKGAIAHFTLEMMEAWNRLIEQTSRSIASATVEVLIAEIQDDKVSA